jgi:peptidoglycan/xylan/chitin deacetylase (PgdA/CDA1 family)
MITMLERSLKCIVILSLLLTGISVVNAQQNSFKWPDGIKAAISLSFDDARLSQVDVGTPLLDQYGVKATFLLVPSAVEERVDKWKKAAAVGHELGNHTLRHPCSGNFFWVQEALENYTLKQMREELIETNRQIERLLGVKATVFAYPCGSTYVGRGVNTKSYVPLIAELFVAGRCWLDETPNAPSFCDFAQLTGMEMDGKDFDQVLPLIENSKKAGSWLVLAGHEIGESGNQTTRVEMLKKLIAYAQDPANGIWIAPMGEIARYVKEQRKVSGISRK